MALGWQRGIAQKKEAPSIQRRTLSHLKPVAGLVDIIQAGQTRLKDAFGMLGRLCHNKQEPANDCHIAAARRRHVHT